MNLCACPVRHSQSHRPPFLNRVFSCFPSARATSKRKSSVPCLCPLGGAQSNFQPANAQTAVLCRGIFVWKLERLWACWQSTCNHAARGFAGKGMRPAMPSQLISGRCGRLHLGSVDRTAPALDARDSRRPARVAGSALRHLKVAKCSKARTALRRAALRVQQCGDAQHQQRCSNPPTLGGFYGWQDSQCGVTPR